jgi:quercetin dioxygenase-like cupin family protein
MCKVCATKGRIISSDEMAREYPAWGVLGWASRPQDTGSASLVVIEVTLAPGQGHDFHKHPNQDEVLYVIDGQVEQWLEDRKTFIKAGDVAFVPKDTVHASFNDFADGAKLLAILGPAVGEGGYEFEDVSLEAPWRDLRNAK